MGRQKWLSTVIMGFTVKILVNNRRWGIATIKIIVRGIAAAKTTRQLMEADMKKIAKLC